MFYHVEQFIKTNNKSLGKYSEQCGEAIHAKFKPTWARFKGTIKIQIMGKKFKSAVVDFDLRRIN